MNWQMMLTNQQTNTNNKNRRKTAAKRSATGSGGLMLWRFATGFPYPKINILNISYRISIWKASHGKN
jgi:hypothetical protein